MGYDAISNSLIVIRSASDSSTNGHLSYIYDFDSSGWIFSTELIVHSKESTNFVTDWNNNLIHAIYDGSSDMDFKKYLPVPSSTLRQEFITKDIDFKFPGTTKKIYSVTMTYKSSAEQQTPLEYAVDGTQSFSSFTSNITPQGNTGGAGYLESTANSGADWDVATFKSASPISCQSIQFRLNLPSTGTFEVNDMTIEYRVIKNKMAS